jgi:hypothetical protein
MNMSPRSLLVFLLLFSGFELAVAQSVRHGTWKARYEPGAGTVALKFVVDEDRAHFSRDFDFSTLEGLSPDDLKQDGRDVSFQIRREAGMLDFSGRANEGRANGTFVFQPDLSYRDAVAARTQGRLTDEHQLVLTVHDLRLSEIDELSGVMSHALDPEHLVQAAIFEITPNYAREMAPIATERPTLSDLVQLRIFQVDRDFVAEMNALGYDGLTAGELVQLRVFDIDGRYVETLVDAGLRPTIDQMVRLKMFGIGPDDLRQRRRR